MKTEYYKKVYINSEDDLPKEKGYYITNYATCVKFDPEEKEIKPFQSDSVKYWMECVRWYFAPIEDNKPIAYEWHNHDTGHCYVDYIPHNLQDENNGYTKRPLYLAPVEQPTDEQIEKWAIEFEKNKKSLWGYTMVELLTIAAKAMRDGLIPKTP